MTGPPAAELVDIHLLGLPVDLYTRASEHQEALLREFRLIAYRAEEGSEVGRPEIPARLLTIVQQVTQRYAGLTDRQDAERERAAEEGRPTVDLHFQMPPHIRQAFLALEAIFDEADDFCRSGQLLTLATPPDLVLFRQWYLGEFVRQVAGEPPRSWQRFRAEYGPASASASVVEVTGPEAPATPE